jgi:hypothetical protein
MVNYCSPHKRAKRVFESQRWWASEDVMLSNLRDSSVIQGKGASQYKQRSKKECRQESFPLPFIRVFVPSSPTRLPKNCARQCARSSAAMRRSQCQVTADLW